MRGSLGDRSTFSALLSEVLLVFALAFKAKAVPLSVGGTVLTPVATPLGATQFTQGNINVIDDATASVLAFAPIPEPGTGALAA